MQPFTLSDGRRYRLRFLHTQYDAQHRQPYDRPLYTRDTGELVTKETLLSGETTAIVELTDRTLRESEGPKYTGVGRCAEPDQFEKATGRLIALNKLCASMPKEDRGPVRQAYFNRHTRPVLTASELFNAEETRR